MSCFLCCLGFTYPCLINICGLDLCLNICFADLVCFFCNSGCVFPSIFGDLRKYWFIFCTKQRITYKKGIDIKDYNKKNLSRMFESTFIIEINGQLLIMFFSKFWDLYHTATLDQI